METAALPEHYFTEGFVDGSSFFPPDASEIYWVVAHENSSKANRQKCFLVLERLAQSQPSGNSSQSLTFIHHFEVMMSQCEVWKSQRLISFRFALPQGNWNPDRHDRELSHQHRGGHYHRFLLQLEAQFGHHLLLAFLGFIGSGAVSDVDRICLSRQGSNGSYWEGKDSI